MTPGPQNDNSIPPPCLPRGKFHHSRLKCSLIQTAFGTRSIRILVLNIVEPGKAPNVHGQYWCPLARFPPYWGACRRNLPLSQPIARIERRRRAVLYPAKRPRAVAGPWMLLHVLLQTDLSVMITPETCRVLMQTDASDDLSLATPHGFHLLDAEYCSTDTSDSRTTPMPAWHTMRRDSYSYDLG